MAVSKATRRPTPPRFARREAPDAAIPGGDGTRIAGIVRLGKRTKLLVPRLAPGDIAVLDHRDIDRVSAEDLVRSGVRAVVNVAPSTTGRYPNQGPKILAEAGIHLVDVAGAPLFDILRDGDPVTVEGGTLKRGDEVLAEGEILDVARVARSHEEARQAVGLALRDFASNTMAHVVDERELLSEPLELPALRTSFRDRPALVVVRGVDHQKDLRMLRPFVRDVKPVLVAVDGGAEAILDAGWTPDMIVGDMDSASDAALRSGAELVVHAYPDGRAPGRARLDALGLPYAVVPAPAMSEDVAMLIAADKGAELIVSVGSHFNLVEFLDKNRKGMSSTFLTRLRVGEILVDAKGVSRLYRPSPGLGPLVFVALAALMVLVVAIAFSPNLGPVVDLLWLRVQVLLGLE